MPRDYRPGQGPVRGIVVALTVTAVAVIAVVSAVILASTAVAP